MHFLMFLFLFSTGYGAIWNIPDDYSTIQEGINALIEQKNRKTRLEKELKSY